MSKLMSGIMQCLNFIDKFRYCAEAVCRIGCYFPKRKIAMIAVILILMFTGLAHSETAEQAVELYREGLKSFNNCNYDKAIENFIKSQAIFEKLESKKGIAINLRV